MNLYFIVVLYCWCYWNR